MNLILNSKKCLRTILRVVLVIAILGNSDIVFSQYIVDFEGASETKAAYASGTVTLTGVDWDMTEALIGTDAADWKNGLRSARLRGYGTSSISMLANKANGIGTISFSYRRYGTDAQVDWKVEYSVDNGSNWIQVGSDFTAPASDVVQTFSEAVNVTGDVRIRIKRATETGTSNRRLNIDDIEITDYSASCSVTITGLSIETGTTGTVVTITGTDFTGATDVTFNGVLASFIVDNATTITATLPSGATTGKVSVTQGCTGTSVLDFTVIEQSGSCSGSTVATDLFISEYVEGSSNNKYIEIFNGTGASVDLSNYNLQFYANAATTPNNNVNLSGTLTNGSVIVYKNSSATIYGGAATNNTAVQFNGDDAVALWKVSTSSYVDIFGCIGEDPGSAWTSGSFTTLDKSLVRKSSVTGGVTTNPASGFPTLSTEWEQYDEDNVSNLGSHTFSSGGSSIVITEQPTSQSDCIGADVNFTVTATGATGYLWWEFDGASWSSMPGETNSTLTITIVDGTYFDNQYYCEVSDGSCTQVTNTVQLTESSVCCTAPADILPTEITFSNITATSMDVDWVPTGTYPDDYTGFVVYIRSTDGIDANFPVPTDGTALPSGSSAPWNDNDVVLTALEEVSGFTISGLEQGTEYFYKVYSYKKCGSTFKFNTTGLIDSYTTLTQTDPLPACAQSSLTLTLPIDEVNAAFEWQVYDGSSWIPVSGGTYSGESSSALTINSLSQSMNGNMYLCKVTGAVHLCETLSASFTVTVNPLPETPIIDNSEDFCGYTELTQGTAPAGVTWFWQGTEPAGTDTFDGNLVYTANSDGTYYLRARTDAGCWSTNSASSVVDIIVAPAPPTAADVYICGAGTATLSVTIGADAVRVDWSLDGATVSYSDDEAPFDYDVTLTDGQTKTIYVRSSNGTCNSGWVEVDAISIQTLNPTITVVL